MRLEVKRKTKELLPLKVYPYTQSNLLFDETLLKILKRALSIVSISLYVYKALPQQN